MHALILHRPGLPGWLSEMLKYQGPNRLAIQMLAWHETLYYHAVTTAVYAEAVGRALGMQDKELEWLIQAAFFHDYGKITWPSALVSKAHLSDDDRKLVNVHPITGEYYLRKYWPDVPDPVCRAIREHHERPDGSGYPAGLKGGEVHPLSVIVATVEVYTALLEHRPYRDKSFTRAEALAELEKQGLPGEVVRVLAGISEVVVGKTVGQCLS
ncbi:HD domain-containing protein [Desulfofundulus australicus DSM 11792]|uniref:HD domain-containing protein n=1 Tax=Desulfofundulus australicus DSM 11792 TaxID=1121425 RepID=A0A1M4XTW2_9FIRM|nr:HD domain-containing phosphohydrolase [Desulfofundulus australicus]SHE96878.1 HD domain-containing protein [Desulfofundulus australicus DSM 11792]